MFEIRPFITYLNEMATCFIIFPMVLALSLYFTFQLRCLQISKLKMSFRCLFIKQSGEGSITHYQAISAVLAGNFGTGNISGMAVALSHGGPGALVWMWVTAFLCAIIQYASCLLAVRYRRQNQQGDYVGGPMYYLKDGLGLPKIAALFALFTLCGALTIGNLAQVNSIVLPLQNYGWDPLLCGSIVAVLAALILIGGLERLARFASVIVPIKASLYLLTVLVILGMHVDHVLPALQLMFRAAFDWHSFFGGVAGYGVLKAMTTGFDRGIFATDAGTGIVPILQAGAKTKSPVIDGVVTLVAPVLVMVVCTATALVLLVTGAWQEPNLYSTNMVMFAFQTGLGHQIGGWIVVLGMILFAYTTLIAWACCGEKAMEYLIDLRAGRWFRYLFLAVIPIGAIVHVEWVWLLADVSITLMLFTNLIGIAGLSREVVQESREFFSSV